MEAQMQRGRMNRLVTPLHCQNIAYCGTHTLIRVGAGEVALDKMRYVLTAPPSGRQGLRFDRVADAFERGDPEFDP